MAKKASNKKPAAPAPNPRRDMFVIMPFSGTKSCTEEQWTDIFENVFSPAAEAAGLACSRARVATGSLIKSIVERLRNSYIVLADITDANPNVFYELGVRHSLSKRTIIVAQGANHIPSDLRGYWSLVYGTGPGQVKKFAEDLKDIVDQINAEPEKADSPVADYLQHEFRAATRHENTEIARKLSALQTEFGGILIELGNPQISPARTSLKEHACLSLFLDSRYLDPGPEILAAMYELREFLRRIAVDGTSSPLVPVAIQLLRRTDEQLRGIRESVAGGSYEQPQQLSVMTWFVRDHVKTNDAAINSLGVCSQCGARSLVRVGACSVCKTCGESQGCS
jgi:hypothetical protein